MKRDEILWNWDPHSVEPVTLSKYVTEYEQIWKWMVEFLSKFQSRGIKIDRVNSISVYKSIIFFNILSAIAPWVKSSWAIVLFALCLRLHPLVYILCISSAKHHTAELYSKTDRTKPRKYLSISDQLYNEILGRTSSKSKEKPYMPQQIHEYRPDNRQTTVSESSLTTKFELVRLIICNHIQQSYDQISN